MSVKNKKILMIIGGGIAAYKCLDLIRILKKNNYQGVLIPDHTPQMTCDAPWHAGMAYAMGYMKAAMAL